ncbi:folylpolyglutamate synthase, mitochondrial [Drosophila ficusphila]|uniref:folylpolyglutamate synthase, mitochondrial n=1 Tax=Drosophila ficusphila TaxID=30025 RepID=UPI0007E6FE5E|nr:folylpolyglutamate synthase, mitochondrial [Drosophila ficusphila]XP_017045725.1 folylpolyglutamate synthase, mitochondrial [Drosophila ficusphila]XP_017045726.1 folylpolyglutamate synthase, mitochondrial [Drosophila ficusphila]
MAARQLGRLVRRVPHPKSLAVNPLSTSSAVNIDGTVNTCRAVSPRPMNHIRLAAPKEQLATVRSMSQNTLAELVFNPSINGNHSTTNGCSSHNNINNNNKAENEAFEEAIKKLNSLQSNDAAIRNSMNNARVDTKADTVKYLERSGLPLETVEQLSFIHVAGTKGKGSTCALTESLLRHQGFRTGFFSSPHIMSTNERIRIDGQLLAKDKFTEQFWKVYNRLWELREHDHDMPAYFKFLTILGFHVFVVEKVDVVVLEVGIGGEHDCTNIVRNVRTVGITSLGLEHTELLGRTLPEIAWQKAGIIKPGSRVFTHVSQPECLEVIRQRTKEREATLYEVPPTEDYFRSEAYAPLWETFSHMIRLNGSLAIQLAEDWISQARNQEHTPNEVRMDPQLLRGLVSTHWPGRCQLVEWQGMRLHLDGAHTLESMAVCTDWFGKSVQDSVNPKILIFNRTGEVGFGPLLELLNATCAFDMVCFVPNLATSTPNAPSQVMVRFSAEMQLKRARTIADAWSQLCQEQKQKDEGQVYDTLTDAFTAIRQRFPQTENGGQLEVLVTGSIHLLGAAISALDLMSPKAENHIPVPTCGSQKAIV